MIKLSKATLVKQLELSSKIEVYIRKGKTELVIYFWDSIPSIDGGMEVYELTPTEYNELKPMLDKFNAEYINYNMKDLEKEIEKLKKLQTIF